MKNKQKHFLGNRHRQQKTVTMPMYGHCPPIFKFLLLTLIGQIFFEYICMCVFNKS